MFHVDNKSGVPEMPPVNPVDSEKPLFFTEEKDKATWPGADWFNIVMMEMFNVLKMANITPNKFAFNQLATAIMRTRDAGRVYETEEAGVDPLDGVPDGYFYNVISNSPGELYRVFRNNAGTPMAVLDETGNQQTSPSGALVKSLNVQMQFLNKTLPEDLSNQMEGLLFAILSDDFKSPFFIDDLNYAQFAGMRDKLQQRLNFLGDWQSSNQVIGWHHLFETADGTAAAGIDEFLKLRLAGLPDAVQDRLSRLGEFDLSNQMEGIHFIGETDGTLKKAWGYVGPDLKLRLAGMSVAVNDLESIVTSLIKVIDGKLALFADSRDEKPIWARETVVGATPITADGIVFTYRKNGQVYAGVISKTPPQGDYKARELDPDTVYVYLILVTGQSLAATQAGQSIVTHDASLDGSALMFSGEGQDRGLVNGENLDPAKLGAMTDLDSPVQARGPGAVQHILRTCRDNNIAMPTMATRTHAKGGAAYNDLKKGTPSFEAGMATAKEFARQVLAMGKKPVIPAEVISHGEANSALVNAIGQYYSDVNEWTNDLQNGIQSATGQTQKPIIFIDQLGSRVRTVSPTSGDIIYGDFIAQDQWQLSLDRDDVVLSTPKYPHNRLYPLDQQHLQQRGYSWLDEHVGQAIYWTLFDPSNTTRRKWNPVQPKKFTVIGNVLRGEFETTPLGYPLAIDYETLGAAPFAGLDFEKGTATVNHFEQVDDFTFEWGLNHAPTSGDFIRLGFNATDTGGFPPPYDNWIFPLVNIRDTSPLMSKYSAQHMWNWSVLARLPV